MASRIVQYFADKLKTVKEYPITLTKAVYDENGNRLDNKLQEIDNSINDVNNSLDKIKIKTDQFTGVNTDVNGVYQTSLTVDSRKVLSARCNVVNAIVIPYYNNGRNLCFVIVNANGFTPYKNLSNVVLAYEYIETI